MKKILIFLFILLVIGAGCTSKKLSREEAFQIIQQEVQYPKVMYYDLHCSDPWCTPKVIKAGPESQGLVRIQRQQKLADLSKP